MPTNIIASFCIALIDVLRPFLGPASCKFSISCTQFAYHALTTQPFLCAVRAIAYRVMRCNPWTNLQEFTC